LRGSAEWNGEICGLDELIGFQDSRRTGKEVAL